VVIFPNAEQDAVLRLGEVCLPEHIVKIAAAIVADILFAPDDSRS